MMGIPVGLLIRVGIAIAIAVAAAYLWHLFTDHYREQGREEIRVEWEAEKAAIAKEENRRRENAERARQESERRAVIRERARAERFAKLDAAKAAAANPLPLSVSDVELFNDARRAAEASRSTAASDSTAAAASASAQAYIVALNEWASKCIERVEQWMSFYRDQQAAFAGTTP